MKDFSQAIPAYEICRNGSLESISEICTSTQGILTDFKASSKAIEVWVYAAGLKTIPCVIKNYTEQEISEIAIIENLQREDLNPIESAKAIKSLIAQFNLTQDEVADKIGKSRSAITNTLRLLTLPESIINLVETDKLSAGHARALLGLEDIAKQKQMIPFYWNAILRINQHTLKRLN